jgi:NAD(P)H dehydrogenase (quinone)
MSAADALRAPDPVPGSALIVLAHPEPTSFSASLAVAAERALSGAGWQVTLADLYAQGFDPALSAGDFTERIVPGRLEAMAEQAHAAANGSFAPDLQWHIDRFLEAELLVLVSPMWWFSVSAMMKGWIDRVLANGVAYRSPEVRPWSGYLSARRGMLVMTASYDEAAFHTDRVGTLEQMLYPLSYGTLAYTGMQVLPPFMAWAADSVDQAQRDAYLDALAELLAGLERS